MSDYGLIVVNDNDEVQIDSTYRNFSKVESGTDTLIANATEIDITDLSVPPIVAWRPDASYTSMFYCYERDGSDYISFWMAGHFPDGGGDIDWVIYTHSNAVLPSDEYGLVVMNAAGEVCFSSEERYLKIKGVHQITNTWDTLTELGEAYLDVTVNDADNNYFILTPFNFYGYPMWQKFPGYWEYDLFTLGIQYINSTTIRVRGFQYGRIVYQGATGFAIMQDLQLLEVGY